MDSKLTVLIDGDNIPSAYIKEMMEEIAKYGNPTIKRIYGCWVKVILHNWKIYNDRSINQSRTYRFQAKRGRLGRNRR